MFNDYVEALTFLSRYCFRPGREQPATDASRQRMNFGAPFMDTRSERMYASNAVIAVCVPLLRGVPPPNIPDLQATNLGDQPYWEKVVSLFNSFVRTGPEIVWPEPGLDDVAMCAGCNGTGCPHCYHFGMVPTGYWDEKETAKPRRLNENCVVDAATAIVVDTLPHPLVAAVRPESPLVAGVGDVVFLLFEDGMAAVPRGKP